MIGVFHNTINDFWQNMFTLPISKNKGIGRTNIFLMQIKGKDNNEVHKTRDAIQTAIGSTLGSFVQFARIDNDRVEITGKKLTPFVCIVVDGTDTNSINKLKRAVNELYTSSKIPKNIIVLIDYNKISNIDPFINQKFKKIENMNIRVFFKEISETKIPNIDADFIKIHLLANMLKDAIQNGTIKNIDELKQALKSVKPLSSEINNFKINSIDDISKLAIFIRQLIENASEHKYIKFETVLQNIINKEQRQNIKIEEQNRIIAEEERNKEIASKEPDPIDDFIKAIETFADRAVKYIGTKRSFSLLLRDLATFCLTGKDDILQNLTEQSLSEDEREKRVKFIIDNSKHKESMALFNAIGLDEAGLNKNGGWLSV